MIILNGKEYEVLFGTLAMQALGSEGYDTLPDYMKTLKAAYYSIKFGQEVNGFNSPTWGEFLRDANDDLEGYTNLLNVISEQQKAVNPKPPKMTKKQTGKKLTKV